MHYRITIRTSAGTQETREVEAESRFAIYSQIGKEGATVLSLREHKGLDLNKLANISLFGSGIKQDHIITMTKNLSGMLTAGLPLSRALSVIERQSSSKRLKAVVTDIEEAVKRGSSFHEALATHENVFPSIYTAMVRAGEESGGLAEALSILGLQMERSASLRRKIRGAMIYPAIVISAVVLVAILMLIFVVPTLTSTFEQLHVQLPLATRVIKAISDFMVANVALVFGMLVAVVVGGIAFFRTHIGKVILLWVALHIPVIGELTRETYAARTARTLSSLLISGVPVIHALEITESVMGPNAFGAVIVEAQEKVKKGELMSSAFNDHPDLYPILVGDMLNVGEETGKIADMLRQVAEFYEIDVEQRTKDLSTIIEPLLMLIIGAGVGIFAVAVISPIYSLSSAI